MPFLQALAPAAPPFTLAHALVLGVVEGLTEFLPVSSTAHLILASDLLRLGESEFVKSFDIIIQLGAILSVVVLYWKRFWRPDVFLKLVVAFIPTGVVGLTVYKAIKAMLGSLTVVLWALLVGGVVMILFERLLRRSDRAADFSEITYGKALLIGIFQALAVVPGVSRAAATIVGGSLLGISRRTIVEFSFMLAVPTMLAASGLELIKNHGPIGGKLPLPGVRFGPSFVVARAALKSFVA